MSNDFHVQDRALSLNACHKSINGLLPHEILMLNYAHTFAPSGNTFQNFWYYSYGVGNPQELLRKLEREGFFVLGGLDSSLASLTVTDLKAILELNGLPQTGTKGTLISRLKESVPAGTLSRLLPAPKYVLTEKGQYELQNNEYVLYIHRHPNFDISLWQMNKWVHDDPNRPWRDHIWAEFNRRVLEYTKRGSGGFYRNNQHNMYSFLTEEGRHEDALSHLAEVMYFDIAVDGINTFKFDGNRRSLAECCTLPPGIVKELEKVVFQLQWDNNTLFDYLHTAFSNMSVFISCWLNGNVTFSSDDAAELVIAQLNHDVFGLEEICEPYKAKLGVVSNCPKCGAPCAEHAKFCQNCGAEISAAAFVDSAAISKNVQVPAPSPHLAERREINKWIAFLLCLFLGWLGAHRFYEKKIWTGILWLLTFGFFYLGWLVDLIVILTKPNPYYVEKL